MAKALGKAFACGASVTDTAGGGKEVVIQGDVLDALKTMLEEKYQASGWFGGWVWGVGMWVRGRPSTTLTDLDRSHTQQVPGEKITLKS